MLRIIVFLLCIAGVCANGIREMPSCPESIDSVLVPGSMAPMAAITIFMLEDYVTQVVKRIMGRV